MPIHKRKDVNGTYYQYGEHGHKYYCNGSNKESCKKAYEKALAQTRAIHAKGGSILNEKDLLIAIRNLN